MKREAMGHTKMKRLCRRLDIPTYHGVGILESLWHLTAREAPRGDIGKLTDEDIALAIDWRGDESQLIDGLVASGWIDRDDSYRLIVHGWQEHADDAVNMKLARAREYFCTGEKPNYTRIGGKERVEIDLFYIAPTPCAQTADPCAQKEGFSAPPVPSQFPPSSLPVPEVPKNGNRSNVAAKPNGEASDGSALTLEKFMAAWNRHHKQNKHESTQRVFQMVLSFNVNWEELEKKHIPYCAYWSKKGWNFCPLSFLQWIENGMLGPPDENPAETREPDWVDPYAGIAEEEEEPPPKSQPEPQRAPAQPHLITRRRAQ